MNLLRCLAECGYPLAGVDQREIIANGETKTISVSLVVHTGPHSHFGVTRLEGDEKVSPRLIHQKTDWKEGELYDSRLVDSTQTALIDTGLFSSVMVTHGDELDVEKQLPMSIILTETKHSSLNFGATYQTFYGFGATFGWENRNIGGMGRRLGIQGDVAHHNVSGLANFLCPNFFRVGQDWIWQAQAMYEKVFSYAMHTYNLLSRLERKIGNHVRVSAGLKFERLDVSESVDNDDFWLLEAPIYFRWSNAKKLLDPARGITFEYTTVPTVNLEEGRGIYLTQEASLSGYYPCDTHERVILAQMLTCASILSSSNGVVPVPKRIFGGTDTDLRGYRYLTVSPVNSHHHPTGGRSAIFYSLEMRLRMSKAIGLVPFYDVGTVRPTVLPAVTGRWLSSVGIGVRYFSLIGPIRFDIGFPLDRRKHIDPHYRVLINIGQAF